MKNRLNLAKERSHLMQCIRDFFRNSGFTEVETPVMVTIPEMEPHLEPFETELAVPRTIHTENAKDINATKKLYLITSPELQMKKLLGEGFGNIFNITKVFRNGEIGPEHNPEFTMIEWYRENADYRDIMNDCEDLVFYLTQGKKRISYLGETIDISLPWPKKSTNELFMEYTNIDLTKNRDFKTFKNTAEENSFDTNGCNNWDDIYFKIFLNHIEPRLPKNRPLFIYDYPASQAALAKIKKEDPFFAERFELYLGGLELGNAFSELTDAHEQKKRLEQEQLQRKNLKKPIFDIDGEFLERLESIKRPCAGIALGIDRLFMLLLDKKSIDEVLLFPLNQQLNANNNRFKERNRDYVQRPALGNRKSGIRKSGQGLGVHQNQTQEP